MSSLENDFCVAHWVKEEYVPASPIPAWVASRTRKDNILASTINSQNIACHLNLLQDSDVDYSEEQGLRTDF